MRRWMQLLMRGPDRAVTLGARGERAAASHLKHTGYRILAKNLRSRFGEIDLLAEHRPSGTIIIVEVKTMRSEDPPPEVHVDHHKRRKLSALASQLVKRYRLEDRPVRFDVIGIVWPEGEKQPSRLTHHEAAFESTL
ncbi:YraN family protein [Planctomycetales bacterium ZRK34]|nr:YraN family protein [Planctomycetales bacterium ZRK34]